MEKSLRKKILIVDDSEMNRLILSDMLESEYELIEACDGCEAEDILRTRKDEICLVLLDVVMPEKDGFEVLADMNNNHWIDDIQVIMISAESSPRFMRKAYDLGAVDFITRPFDHSIVHRRIVNTMVLNAKHQELSAMVAEQVLERENTSRMMVAILSHIVECRNGESGRHVQDINIITRMLLKSLLSKTGQYDSISGDIDIICLASSLHDIGKIDIPSHILNKPGRLDREEFERIKTHTVIGAEMMDRLPAFRDEPLVKYSYQICRWHHERWDGRGYPDGLAGDSIPIAAQLVSIADVYDALISERCYKPAYSHEKAIEMIMNGECGTFNPLLLECLRDIGPALKNELCNA